MRAPVGTATVLVAPALILLASTLADGLTARQLETGWDSSEALELAALGRRARSTAAARSTRAESYRARATGTVNFFFDRSYTGERILIRADQLALDLYWAPRFGIRQQIVGWRDVETLPTDVRYHLDHLTVLHDDFADHMHFGDGDEVADVLHPLAPGSGTTYSYRMGESLVLLPGPMADSIRVRELIVRPRSEEAAAFVGSLYLDTSSGAIAKADFTFTSPSYDDDNLEYVRVALENGYWSNARWLPRRQTVELRREAEVIDLLGGTVIQTRFEVGPYAFGDSLPSEVWGFPAVTALPEAERESFPFTQEVLAQAMDQGFAEPPSLTNVRLKAGRILAEKQMRAFFPFRAHTPRLSDLVRYNRTEGLYLGAGLALRPLPGMGVRLLTGYSFALGTPSFAVSLEDAPEPTISLRLEWDRMRDIGQVAGIDPTLNSLSVALGLGDGLDLFRVRGVTLSVTDDSRQYGGRHELGLRARFEEHAWAPRQVGSQHPDRSNEAAREHGEPLPVRPGTLVLVDGSWASTLPSRINLELAAQMGNFSGDRFGGATAKADWISDVGFSSRFRLAAQAGALTSLVPPQELFVLGGRGTVPGYPYRSYSGDRYWMAQAEVNLPIRQPWLSLRLATYAGATSLSVARRQGSTSTLPRTHSPIIDSDGVLASVGAGVDLGWHLLRLDLARAIRGGGWEFFLSLNPRLRPWS